MSCLSRVSALVWILLCGVGLVSALRVMGPATFDVPQAWAEDDEEEEEKKKVEIPSPPNNYFGYPADLSPKVKKEYDDALKLYGRYMSTGIESVRSRARKALEKVKRKAPNFVAPYYYLAVIYQHERDYRKARKVIKDAIKREPEFYEMHVELGDVEVHEGKPAEAIPHYERALAIYPWFDYGLDRMSQVLIQLGRFKEAEAFVTKAMAHGESEGRVQCRQAIDFEVKGPKWSGETHISETDDYVVKSNHSQAMADELAEEIDLTRKLFDKLFPDIKKADRKYLIVVYDSRTSYIEGGEPAYSAGYYSGLSKRICMFVNPKRIQMLQTLKHEAFHQYVDEYVTRAPSWFGEGFAEYYAATELVQQGKKRAVRIRPHKENLQAMMVIFERNLWTPVAELMQMSQYEMYDVANNRQKMGIHYAQSWSLIYFCAEGPYDAYRKHLIKYFKQLMKGKSREQAFKATFGRVDMSKFEKQWIDFIKKTNGIDKGI